MDTFEAEMIAPSLKFDATQFDVVVAFACELFSSADDLRGAAPMLFKAVGEFHADVIAVLQQAVCVHGLGAS